LTPLKISENVEISNLRFIYGSYSVYIRIRKSHIRFWPTLEISIFLCYIIMLQCPIWGRGTGNACEWESLTQGIQGEGTEQSVTPLLLRVSALFMLPGLRKNFKSAVNL